jgi:predicted dehydrogenase
MNRRLTLAAMWYVDEENRSRRLQVHILDYEHTFAHTIKDLIDGIAPGKSPAPNFEDCYRCQAVLDAVERSAESRA